MFYSSTHIFALRTRTSYYEKYMLRCLVNYYRNCISFHRFLNDNWCAASINSWNRILVSDFENYPPPLPKSWVKKLVSVCSSYVG